MQTDEVECEQQNEEVIGKEENNFEKFANRIVTSESKFMSTKQPGSFS